MPNLDPWLNQNEEHIDTKTITNKFENHLLSIKDEHQKRIQPDLHPTYNQHHEISFVFGGIRTHDILTP